MTRDEAKSKINTFDFLDFQEDIVNDLIDDIYYAFESRNCKNCKYCQDEVCCNDESLLCADFINEDFCCNKWEHKCTP